MRLKFEIIILLIALLWYSMTAYFSIGYHHPDEHYQIIEFAGLLDGTNTVKDLPWEYNAQIRPTIQPILCYSIFNICDFFSITNSYDKAFVLRLITGLLSVFTIYFFTNSAKNLISNIYWKPFLILSYFIWFLPFINVRFSSETWSGLALLSALALIIRDNLNYKTFIFLGVLLGLGFLFRFQIAFAVIGILLWLLFERKESISNIALMILAGLVVVVIGVGIDSWYYGDFVFTPWNYLKVNIIEGVASNFGIAPWYYYVNSSLQFSILPIGIVLISLFIFFIYKKPKSIFVWTLLPFIVIHSAIAHKEFRFLFPIINCVPIIIILTIQTLGLNELSKRWSWSINLFFVILLFINLEAIIIASIIPAGHGRFRLTQSIHNIVPHEEANLFFVRDCNPFEPCALSTNFYEQKNVYYVNLGSFKQKSDSLVKKRKRNFLVLGAGDLDDQEMQNFISKMKFKKINQSTPEFAVPFMKLSGFDINDILFLYGE